MIPYGDVNYLAVVVATILNIVVGMVWYSPAIFGTDWMKCTGMTEEKAKKGMPMGMVIGIAGSLIGAFGTAILHMVLGPASIAAAVELVIVLTLAIIVPIQLGRVAWEQAPMELFCINTGYYAVSVLIIVMTLQVWP